MEQEPARESDGKIAVRPNPYARKDSGSFYTPQELVDLIIDQTLKPLVEEASDGVRGQGKRVEERPPSAARASHRTGNNSTRQKRSST